MILEYWTTTKQHVTKILHMLLLYPLSASASSLRRPGNYIEAGHGTHNAQIRLLQQQGSRTAKVHTGETTAWPECSCLIGFQPRSLWPRQAKPNSAPLPVSYRVKLKLCCLLHAIYYSYRLTYLTEAQQLVSTSRSHSELRSSSTSLIDYHIDSLPQLCKRFGKHWFSHAGPAIWNALLDNIRTMADPVRFRNLTILALLLIFVDYFLRVLQHILDFRNSQMFLFL